MSSWSRDMVAAATHAIHRTGVHSVRAYTDNEGEPEVTLHYLNGNPGVEATPETADFIARVADDARAKSTYGLGLVAFEVTYQPGADASIYGGRIVTAEQLADAGRRMQLSTRVKKSEADRVVEVAVAMRHGKADKQRVAWAKRVAKGFLPS